MSIPRIRRILVAVSLTIACAATMIASGYTLLNAAPVPAVRAVGAVAQQSVNYSLQVTQTLTTTNVTTDSSVISATTAITDTEPLTHTQQPTSTQVITATDTDTATEEAAGDAPNEAGEERSSGTGEYHVSTDVSTGAATGDTTDDTADPVAGSITITADNLGINVRTGPGSSYTVVGKLRDGAALNVLEISADGQWYRVPFGAIGWWGWIDATFTDTPPTMRVGPGDDEVAADETDPADGVEDAEAESEDAASEGDTDSDIDNGVDGASSKDGDADNPDAEDKVSADNADPAEAEVTVPTAVTRPPNMNIRGGPGTNYGVVDTARTGTRLEILGVNGAGDWYQVQLDDAAEPGWIFASLTEVLGLTEQIPQVPEDEIPEAPQPPAVNAAAGDAAPPPSGGGFFGYGIQAHMLGGGIDAATNATSQLGFNWLKQQVQWRDFEGTQGAIDFSELRRIVDSAGGRGISVLFSVVNAPDWAREPGFDASVGGPPAEPQTLGNFVARLAGDFCGSALKAIEVWNEQNLHYEWGNKPINPAEYMNLLRVAYGRIKGACPSMLVISGAPTPAGDAGAIAMDDFTYLEAMYQNGLAGVADGIGVHPSGYNVPPNVGWQSACATIQQTGNFFNGPCDTPHHSWSFRSTMEGYRNIMVRYGDVNKRLWPTEFGWAAGGALHPAYAYANDNDFEEQARWTVEAYRMMRNWGWVGPAFLWNLNFRVIADGTEKAQWGIVRNDYSPLPIYGALQAMPK